MACPRLFFSRPDHAPGHNRLGFAPRHATLIDMSARLPFTSSLVVAEARVGFFILMDALAEGRMQNCMYFFFFFRCDPESETQRR